MKWLPQNGSTQHTTDKQYCVVQANTQDVIAYLLGPTAGKELGKGKDFGEAREICEEYDTLRKRA